MKDRGLIAAFTLMFLAVFALPAYASDGEIVLPFQVLRGLEGSELVLYDGPMPVVGEECTVIARDAGNNTSVHPGNDLKLTTGGESIYFEDVERDRNVSTPGSGQITPGDTGQVVLVFGPDEVYSADLVLEFTCQPASTTTSSTTSTTLVETTTTTSPISTSTTVVTPTTAPATTSPLTELPFTGVADWLFPLGAALVLGGIGFKTWGERDQS